MSMSLSTPPVWGTIVGTITNQTDLTNLLNTGYLKIDQTLSQTIINGLPMFGEGLIIKSGKPLVLDG